MALVSAIHRFSLLDCSCLRFAAAVSDKMLLLCLRKPSLLSCAVLVCYQTEKNSTQASNLPDCPVLKHQFTLVLLWSAFFFKRFALPCKTPDFFENRIKGTVKNATHSDVFLLLWNIHEFLKNVHTVVFQILKSKGDWLCSIRFKHRTKLNFVQHTVVPNRTIMNINVIKYLCRWFPFSSMTFQNNTWRLHNLKYGLWNSNENKNKPWSFQLQ